MENMTNGIQWKPFTEKAQKALIEMEDLKEKCIRVENLLLAIIKVENDTELGQVLIKYGITHDRVGQERKKLSTDDSHWVAPELLYIDFSNDLEKIITFVYDVACKIIRDTTIISNRELLLGIIYYKKSLGYSILRQIISEDEKFENFVNELKELPPKITKVPLSEAVTIRIQNFLKLLEDSKKRLRNEIVILTETLLNEHRILDPDQDLILKKEKEKILADARLFKKQIEKSYLKLAQLLEN